MVITLGFSTDIGERRMRLFRRYLNLQSFLKVDTVFQPYYDLTR
jgi:hypothetical protein